ncbi:MAG: class I SAM-dependent methyltransferase [Pseudomonadota bacterium]
MSFSSDWLTLRRPADAVARNSKVAGALAAHFQGRPEVRVIDLGAGTGSNRLLTAPHLPPAQSWVHVDSDETLLAQIEPVSGVTTCVFDLAADLDPLLSAEFDLVTCSALLDLCGAVWLDEFASLLHRDQLPLYAVLSYDGRELWEPTHPSDKAVYEAFLADQRTDKGLGLSLGPGAHSYLADRLRQLGFTVHEGQSDWILGQSDYSELIAALAEGAGAVGGDESWTAARRIAERVTIGHQDLLALPPA